MATVVSPRPGVACAVVACADPRVTRWERRTGVIKLTYLIAL